MNYHLTILLSLLLTCSIAFAQNDPHWTKSEWRDNQYPSETYLTGYSRDVKSNDETFFLMNDLSQAFSLLEPVMIVSLGTLPQVLLFQAYSLNSE